VRFLAGREEAAILDTLQPARKLRLRKGRA
jgi:hypothetical protein